MINVFEVRETNKMIEESNLDVRTITMGISLLDCCDNNVDVVCEKIYRKITEKAANLVKVGEQIELDYGIPIVNKRISVTPIALVGGSCCKTPEDYVKIAKNYLSEIELQRLNLLVSGFLDFAEFQALEMNPMTMKDWIEALDNQIIVHKRKVLIGKGHISHKQAIEKAEKEFEIYRKREMELLESDFDREIKRLRDKNDGNSK